MVFPALRFALAGGTGIVLFNRSWYNRAGVEHVMEFCTEEEYRSFLQEALPFEHMLIGAGIQILKYYLDIGKKEQEKTSAGPSGRSAKAMEDEPYR